MQSVGNTFFIRTVQPNRPTTTAPDYPRNWLTLDPPCAEFNDYPSSKISICKLNLKNESRFPRRVSLVQPSKAYFEVKIKSRQLPPNDTTQVYIVFNPQREKGRIEDEFCIKVDGEGTVLHVPIICQYKAAGRAWSSKQIIYSKQNQEKVSRGPPKRRMAVPRSRQISIENRYRMYVDIKKISLIQFQEKFERVYSFIEQKKVKNEVCRGQKPIDSRIRGQIMQYCQKIAQLSRRTVGQLAVERWSVEYRQEGPVLQLFSGVNLAWDPSRNSSELVLRNGLGKMQEEVRKFIVSIRFDRIKHCFNLFKDFKTREEVRGKAMKVDDYLQQLKRLENRTGNELQFQFDKRCLRHQQLPVDYQRGAVETNFLERNARFDIMQRIGFDNWVTVNWLREDYVQNYQTTAHPLPPYQLHMPAYTRGNRRGALGEMALWMGSGCQLQLSQGWGSGQWDQKVVWEMVGRQERYYYPQTQDKVEIGDEKLCLGDDPQKWLQDYIKQL